MILIFHSINVTNPIYWFALICTILTILEINPTWSLCTILLMLNFICLYFVHMKKESITYLSAALSTHTHEEEAPWLCRTPAIDAIGAQMPFICHQLLWVLDNYPFILRLALGLLGATFWKCLGYSALLISDPQSISDWSYKVQKADPLPQERNTLI